MDKMQLEKGQIVVYGTSGICVIEEIKPIKITMDSRPEPYYVLRQKSNSQSTVFVPVGNDKLTSKIRRPMTREEILSMFSRVRSDRMKWDTDRRVRTDRFREILAGGVSDDLLRMAVCLHERKDKLFDDGKRLPVTDINTLKSVSQLLEEEVSYAFGIDEKDAGEYIKKEMKK